MKDQEFVQKREEIMKQTIKAFVSPEKWGELYNIVKEVWTRAYINDLPDAAFALILPGGKKDDEGKTTPRSLRKLPHHNEKVKDPNEDSTVDWPHLVNALARLPQVNAPEDLKQKAEKHLRGHYDRIKGTEKVTEKIRQLFATIAKGKVAIELDADRETVMKGDLTDGVIQWHVVSSSEIVTIARIAKQFSSLGTAPAGWTQEDFNELVTVFKGLEDTDLDGVILHYGHAVDAITEYDAPGVLFVKVSYEDDPEVFNVLSQVQKGSFVLIADRGQWAVLEVAKSLDLSLYQVSESDPVVFVSSEKLEGLDGLQEFDGKIAPKLKRVEFPEQDNDRAIHKAVIPNETGRSQWERVQDALYRYLWTYEGVFFGNSCVELYDIIDDTQLIVRVHGESEGYFRLYYYIDSNGVTQINATRQPEPVYLQNTYISTNSVVSGVQGKSASISQDTESTEEIEKREVITRDVKVVSHTLRKQGDIEERYILGVVLEPNDGTEGAPYNPDAQGDIYDAETIRKAAFNWMRDYQVLGVMHAEPAKSRISVVESYIAPVDMDVEGQKIVKGTWLLGAIVNDADLWEKVKRGEFTGWSIGGYATVVDETETENPEQ